MSRSLFGTDGVRGRANAAPMTAEIAMRIGMAAGQVFNRGDHRHLVVIGKDTRLSGYMIEPALTAGFCRVGMDVVLVGPLPTPAVAMLTRSCAPIIGVVVSASHNPFEDNGIKLFGPDGYKLSDEVEARDRGAGRRRRPRVRPPMPGDRPRQAARRRRRPLHRVRQGSRPARAAISTACKIVVDCAHGAAYKVAPTVLWELGAEVFPLGVAPDGLNINRECGATDPGRCCERWWRMAPISASRSTATPTG